MMYQVLVVGKNIEINQTVVRLLQGYDKISTQCANSLESTQSLMKEKTFDVIMNCGGFTEEEESNLYEMKEKLFPNLKILEHFGGGSGLLLSELKQTLNI